jgi:hypothetical protein
MHTGGERTCGEREGAQGGYSAAHGTEAADEAGNGLRLRRMEDLELLDMRPEGKSSVRRHGMMRGDEMSADMSMWEEGNNIVARIGMSCCIVLYRVLSYRIISHSMSIMSKRYSKMQGHATISTAAIELPRILAT